MSISTSCYDCVFAKYEDNIQIDCELNRLDLYRKYDIPVNLVNNEDGRQAYLISGRICTACRNSEWGKNNPPKTEWANKVKKQMDMRYLVIIIADDNLELLEKTIKSISEQILPSTELVVARTNKNIQAFEISGILKNYRLNSWKITTEQSDFEYGRCINKIVDNSKGTTFYAVINEGIELDKDVFSEINRRVNEELLQFSMLKVDGITIYNTAAHYHLDGHYDKPLSEKIEEVLNGTP